MWTPEKERRQFELVWEFLWPAVGSVFGLILGGFVGGALGGLPKALLGAVAGGLVGAEAGHLFGCLGLLIFRPWIDFFTSGTFGSLLCGFVATVLIALWAVRAIDDMGLAIFVSCLGFSLGDGLFFACQVILNRRRKRNPVPETHWPPACGERL